MNYRKTSRIDVPLSRIGLGGHEYLPDGASRGFNEDGKLAVTPGHIFPGFGEEKRKRVLRAAYEHKINFFDVTLDSEIEALGRNLKELPPPYEIAVQTRPQGMVYSYDPGNRKMATYELLEIEVQRLLGLLKRDRLDFLNVAFMHSALEEDPYYLDKIDSNVRRLKDTHLIRFACADTFSGEATYLRQIETGCFDAVFINFSFADDCARQVVLPDAAKRGMAVIAREVFMKGALFAMGDEAGVTDRDHLARVALKWVLSHDEVTIAMVGADTPEQLANGVSVVEQPELDSDDNELLKRIRATRAYMDYAGQKRKQFGY
jgi:aryl-alcohol dehydrogenase-like predicted oxidoreductase